MAEDKKLWLRTLCQKEGLGISDAQLNQLDRYVALLLEWNEKINLVSRKDTERIWENHIAHSLAPLFRISIPARSSLLDLGSGGGLPGIPWKILLPETSLTMIDSTQKKMKAVEGMVSALQLPRTRAVWGRAEELAGRPDMRKKFDVVLARGVGPLEELIKLSLPFVRHEHLEAGSEKQNISTPALLAFKGGSVEDEMQKAKRVTTIHSMETIPLNYPGAEEMEKKLVIATFEHSGK